MSVEEKNWKHQTKIGSESRKVGNVMKNATKSQCLKKKGERKMMKNWNAADRKNEKGEKNRAKGNMKERKA
uniref:Uncharacterized protein n=1 Tax=Romanomermis culicivorax TaxID=13658 RepID=A0A915IDR7_ROMCU